MRAGALTNDELVREICRTATEAVDHVAWPYIPPRLDVPRLVHAYIQDHTVYVEETGEQVVRFPRATVLEGRQDCKSAAIFAAALARAAGLDARLRFIRTASRPWWSHVYAVLDGVPCDPLLPLGQEAPRTGALEYRIP